MNADEAAVVELLAFGLVIGLLVFLDVVVVALIGPDPDLRGPWDPRR